MKIYRLPETELISLLARAYEQAAITAEALGCVRAAAQIRKHAMAIRIDLDDSLILPRTETSPEIVKK